MKAIHPGLHPEVLATWEAQREFKDPLEFLRKVYLIKNPPEWAINSLKKEERSRNEAR